MHEHFMAEISCNESVMTSTDMKNSLCFSINALTCSPWVFGGAVVEGSEGVCAAAADQGSWCTPPCNCPQDAGVWVLS